MPIKCRDCDRPASFYVDVILDGGDETLDQDAYFCWDDSPSLNDEFWNLYIDGSRKSYALGWIARAMDVRPADVLEYHVTKLPA